MFYSVVCSFLPFCTSLSNNCAPGNALVTMQHRVGPAHGRSGLSLFLKVVGLLP